MPVKHSYGTITGMDNTVIIIFSDPVNSGEEALGRLFNGFAAAFDIKQAGGKVTIIFQGTGTRWAALSLKKITLLMSYSMH